MLGIDISNHQRNLDLTKINHDFAIIKLTEGLNYEDPSAGKFIKKELELGKHIGVYHFARPDLRIKKTGDVINGMKLEAEEFSNAIAKYGLIGRAIPVLDWEKEPFNNIDAVMAFLDTFQNLTGVKCWIYGSISKLKQWKDTAIMDRPIWGAYYKTIDANKYYGSYPASCSEMIDNNWSIWQYTSTAKTEQGITVDANYTYIAPEQWEFHAEIMHNNDTGEVYPFIQHALYTGIIGEEDRIFFGDDNKLEIILKIYGTLIMERRV